MGYNKIDEIGAIEEMVKKYPNDSELGKKNKRAFYS